MSLVIGRSRRSFLWACAAAVVLPLTVAVAAEELRRAVSHRDEKLSIEGVNNFGRMNERLYRGAQPTPEGFAHLRALGIDTVVRLSLNEEAAAEEQALVESLGMRFVGLPWSTVNVPTTEHVAEFLKLVKGHPDRRIFVHCKAGSDRTGVFIALYRIVMDRWTPDQAIDEMKAFHYRYLFLPHLQEYVETFPARLSSEPAFVALETANLD